MDNDCGFVVENGSRWEVSLAQGPSILAATPRDVAEFITTHAADRAAYTITQYDGYWLSFTVVPANPDNEGWLGPFGSSEYAIEVALDCLADPELAAADCMGASWDFEDA